jgi:hypothetical protein
VRVVFLSDAGTAVTFLFTSDSDLSFTEASARREIGGCRERRVLTFPSGGCLLAWKFELNLFVGLGGCLGFGLPVCRGEDAERHGDAGFKVQVGDLGGRERADLLARPFAESRKEDDKKTTSCF